MQKSTFAVLVAAMLFGLVGSFHVRAGDEAQTEATQPPSQSITQNQITLTLTAPATLVTGAENIFKVKIANGSDEPVEWYGSFELKGLKVSATRQGEAVPRTIYGQDIMVNSAMKTRILDKHTVAKGEEMEIAFNLTRYLDISLIGDYEIQVSWHGKSPNHKEWQTLTTPPLKVRIDDTRK